MKTCVKNLFPCLGAASTRSRFLPALTAGLGLILTGRVTAQTFTTLHHFNGSDESNPQCSLILSGNTLYGTVFYGGSSTKGAVFAVNTNGTGYTNLYSFTATSFTFPFTNSDGVSPEAGLILSGNTLYGTARIGGSSANGTVFKVNTNGTGFTNLHSFTATSNSTNSDGANPYAGLILSGNTLYGTAYYGGSSGNGTVFRVSTDSMGFTNLHSFTTTHINSLGSDTNSDGINPYAGLILSGNTLYGTAYAGGNSSFGTVFRLNTDGTGFTNLHNFDSTYGAYPYAGLILSDNTLYGTTVAGGSPNRGTIFKVNTDGASFTNLYSFTGNDDAANPYGGLILSGNTLYGTTAGASGSSPPYGTVFKLYTDGTGFTNLYSFDLTYGAYPNAGLILSGDTLYGTTVGGGSSGAGTVFSLSLEPVSAPLLTIIPSGANVILTWPTNAAVFTLQSTTNLVSPAVWSTNPPAPAVVSGQNTVTNPVSGTQKFYRLIQ